MKLEVLWITPRRGRDKEPAVQALTEEYRKRLSRFVTIAAGRVESEAALIRRMERSRTAPVLIALDSTGKQYTSEEFAAFIEQHQSRGTQILLFAIGAADGFSAETLKQANLVLSLGKMMLPHGLARVVLMEQLYRTFTILKGHPYHKGHCGPRFPERP